MQQNDYGIEDVCDSIIEHHQDNELQAMIDELRDFLNAIPRAMQPTSGTKSWTERREQLEQSWEDHRAKLFEDLMTSMALLPEMECSVCGDTNAAIIRCHQCWYSTMAYLCSLCDDGDHHNHPLHDREYWNGHYFSFIPPTQFSCPSSGNLIDTDSEDSCSKRKSNMLVL
ncbi:uncharacterized protein [Dysidea avara]